MLFNRHVEVAMVSDPGRIRSENQDAVYKEFPFFFIADGVGGLPEGRLASEMAIRVAAQHVRERIFSDRGHLSTDEDLLKLLLIGFHEANKALRDYATQKKTALGTTMTGVLLANKRVYSCHVGDSPLFLLKKGHELQQITTDHRCEDQGRPLLTKALGIEAAVSPDVCSVPIHSGDTILLCTDGISALIGKHSLKSILAMEVSVKEKSLILLGRALAEGGPDNASAILIQVRPEDSCLRRGVQKLFKGLQPLFRKEMEPCSKE